MHHGRRSDEAFYTREAMTDATDLTRRVAAYGQQLRYEAISPEAIERAKQLLLDFIGVALGGAALWPEREAMVRGVSALAAGAAGDATVVSQRDRFLRQ